MRWRVRGDDAAVTRAARRLAPWMVVFALACAAPVCAQPPAPRARTLRESLRSADEAQSGFSAMKGFLPHLTTALSDDAVMLVEGAPVLRGREAIVALLKRQSRFSTMRVAWQPLRVLVSQDSTLGVTFGATAISGPNLDQNSFGRYVSVWRRGQGETWNLVAQVQTGLIPAGQLVLPAGAVAAMANTNPRDPFALADLAFAALANDSTAPVAFRRYSAPNGMTFAGNGELNIGPDDIFASMAAGPAARASWRWWPVLTIAASSGDLGVTIGEAEITPPQATAPNLSKYLTVWQRQPDGSLKFVVDAGNARPPKR